MELFQEIVLGVGSLEEGRTSVNKVTLNEILLWWCGGGCGWGLG